MKIGIEMRQMVLGASGGMVQNLKGVLETAIVQYPQHEFFAYCTFANRDLLKVHASNLKLVTLPTNSYFPSLSRQASLDGINVLFRTYPSDHVIDFPFYRQIVYIPDIQHDIFPEFFDLAVLRSRRLAFNELLSKIAAIGTISNFSRQAILDHPWNKTRDIFLMSPALPTENQQAQPEDLTPQERGLIPDHPFFYFPGNLWPHKNHRRIFQAFDLFLKNVRQPVDLVLTGHPDGWPQLQAEFPDLPVHHLGFVNPQLVRQLYEKSIALLFFTLYEGFGIPLLEAFDAGTPVLCSNASSLPEVGGDAVLSCDPMNVQAMSELIKRIYTEPALRSELIQKGRLRLNDYTWEKSARNFIQACERVSCLTEKAHAERLNVPDPLVTIVTPSYNQAKYIGRTIESVRKQSYPHIEYIVMDGGSTDGTLDILKSYGNQFFWRSEKDRGQANAINQGLALAKGEILAYLNSDDMLLPGSVEKVVRYFKNHPECDMVYGQADFIDENDQVIGKYNTADYTFGRMVFDNCICQPAAFWRSRVMRLAGPLDETLHTAMDHEFWMRIDRAGAIIQHDQENLACSRIHADTKTLTARDVVFDEIFRISTKYAGYISISYYTGYWYHRVWEKDTGWPRYLRRIPYGFKALGYLHWFWSRRHRIPYHLISFFRYRVVSAILRRSNFLQPITQLIRSKVYRVDSKKPVSGVYPDNTLAPIVQIYLKNCAPGKNYFLGGMALLDTRLIIKAGHETTADYTLKAGEYRQFEIYPGTDPRIQLQFTNYTTNQDGYFIAFTLTDTNLFTEQDAFH